MISQTDIRNIVDTFSDNTLSLYLRVNPGYIENQSDTPEWEIYLKNAMRDIEQSIDDSQADYWKDIKQQIDNYFMSYTPGGRTLVMFIDGNQQRVEELPFAMRSRNHFGKPLVSPLLWAIDEYEDYIIVMVDHKQAIMRKAYLGNLEKESEMTIDLAYDWGEKTMMPAAGADGEALRQGNNREAFEDMISAHVKRFYKDVANEIREIFDNGKPTRLILGGNERSAHAVRDHLHQSVKDNLVATLPISMKASDQEIMDKVRTVAYDFERNFEFDLIEDVTNRALADGRGALGRENVDKALEMQQVELIVMPFSLLQDDPDYAHDLALWALENNSQLEFVHAQAERKLKNHGDIAARLYYSIESV